MKKTILPLLFLWLISVICFSSCMGSPSYMPEPRSNDTTEDRNMTDSIFPSPDDKESQAPSDESVDTADSADTTDHVSPLPEDTAIQEPSDKTADTTEGQNETESTAPSTDDTTSSSNVGQHLVWIPESGNKYHSKPGCSNMKSPRQIPLEDAILQGYTPCKRCH